MQRPCRNRRTAFALLTCLAANGCGPPEPSPRSVPAATLPAEVQRGAGAQAVEHWAEAAAESVAELQGASLLRAGNAIAIALPHDGFAPRLLTGAMLSGRSAIEREGMSVVVGSGFASETRSLQPLGLLQADGVIVSPLAAHGYTRIVGFRDDRLAVIRRGTYHRGLFEFAIQVGPGVVEGGALAIRPRERNLPAYFRAFVATCAEAHLAGITTAPAHLYDLGRDLMALSERMGLNCAEVANLAGDREALLGIRGTRAQFFAGHADTAKAALIGFRRARQADASPSSQAPRQE